MNPILITGALGNVGMELVQRLLSAGQTVRAASRDVQAVSARFGTAVEAVRFDFTDPTTYHSALVGVERMFLLRPPAIADVRRSISPLIDAAKQAGVHHIVFLSLIGVEQNPIVPHYTIEQYILKSQLNYTFLRPSFFMQNLSSSHRDEIRQRDEIFVPAGTGMTNFVDVRDLAAVAALALSSEQHINTIYELTGSVALDYYQVAAQLSTTLGRTITYTKPSLLQYIYRQRAGGAPWPLVLVLSAIYTTTRLGRAGRTTGDLRRILGRDPISFQQFAADYKACWQHAAAQELG